MAYREQNEYGFEAKFNGDTILADWSEEHGLTGEPHLLVRVEENGAEWYEGDPEPWGEEIRMPADFARSLHRYLSALVLPTVERGEAVFSGETRFATGDPWVGATARDGWVLFRDLSFPPTHARALAACLLAAADEAEGVTPC